VIGLDCNPFCEKPAIERLHCVNNSNQNNVHLEDYLIGYAENMSNIRSESIEIVLLTDFLSQVDNSYDILKEVYRVLKPVIYIFNFFHLT